MVKRCQELYVNERGERVDSPYRVLGIGEEDGRDEEVIRRAWVEQIQAHPPERDPEGAAKLREARDRLLNPEKLFERVVGKLCIPDPEAFDLNTVKDWQDPRKGRMEAKRRFLGMMCIQVLKSL